MKIAGKSKEEFIQPIGLLDSITKWLSVSAVDVEYTHPTTEYEFYIFMSLFSNTILTITFSLQNRWERDRRRNIK